MRDSALSEQRYSMKEAASLTGVDERTLRRWDAAGIARASIRTSGGGARRGHRRYTQQDIKRVIVVKLLRASDRVKYRDLGAIADALERS